MEAPESRTAVCSATGDSRRDPLDLAFNARKSSIKNGSQRRLPSTSYNLRQPGHPGSKHSLLFLYLSRVKSEREIIFGNEKDFFQSTGMSKGSLMNTGFPFPLQHPVDGSKLSLIPPA